MTIRSLITLILRSGAALVLAFSTLHAQAQTAEKYPQRPIKWLVPYPVGGGLDAVTRMYSNELASHMDQPVIVDNRVGASGTIGIAAAVKAPADGHNLLSIDNNAYTTHSLVFRNLTYNAPRDLQIVATLARVPVVLAVTADHPAKTYQQFIDSALADPGRVVYASPGIATPQHIGMELLQSRTGARMLHVPFKGAAAMLTDLAGGRANVALSDYGSIKPFYDAGKVPTFDEVGLRNFPISIWHAVAVPTGTPQSAIDALRARLEEASRSQSVRDQLAAISAESFFQSGAKVSEFARSQVEFWQGIVRPLNIRLD
jgi:tripartite-type tricarboxylate transporter receptor subunit TctC